LKSTLAGRCSRLWKVTSEPMTADRLAPGFVHHDEVHRRVVELQHRHGPTGRLRSASGARQTSGCSAAGSLAGTGSQVGPHTAHPGAHGVGRGRLRPGQAAVVAHGSHHGFCPHSSAWSGIRRRSPRPPSSRPLTEDAPCRGRPARVAAPATRAIRSTATSAAAGRRPSAPTSRASGQHRGRQWRTRYPALKEPITAARRGASAQAASGRLSVPRSGKRWRPSTPLSASTPSGASWSMPCRPPQKCSGRAACHRTRVLVKHQLAEEVSWSRRCSEDLSNALIRADRQCSRLPRSKIFGRSKLQASQ